MITVNSIGGSTLSSAVVAEKAQTTQHIAPAQELADGDLGASLAAYMSLPGFNASSAVDAGQNGATDAQADGGQTAALQALSNADDDNGLTQALKEFDDGLKSLSQRPETQFFRARFGSEAAPEVSVPPPAPLPGFDENGVLRMPGRDSMSADANQDGKISEEELHRYQEPLTYRTAGAGRVDALADGPSAFSLVEANRAYGVVSAAAAAA